MDSTFVELTEAETNRLATGYGRRMPDGTREVIPFWEANGMTAAFGMISNVTDLAKYVSWQMRLTDRSTNEILSPATWRRMQRVQWVDPDWTGGWGFGFQVVRRKEQTLVGHTGQVPGYFSTTYVDPKQKLGVIVLTNSMDSEPYLGQTRSIPERVFDWLGPALKKASENDVVAPSPPDWERLLGTYRCIWCDIHVMILDGKLVMVNPSLSDPKSTASTLEPIEGRDHVFRIVDGPDPQLAGAEVVFEFRAGTPDGRAIHSEQLETCPSPLTTPRAESALTVVFRPT